MFPAKSALPLVVLLLVCFVGLSWSRQAHPPHCEDDYFMCPAVRRHHPTCIPDSWVCDDDADCPGGEDEQRCDTRSVTCEEGEFLCSNRRECVPNTWICDGDEDCDDDSDETPQACAARGLSAPVENNDDDDDGDDDNDDADNNANGQQEQSSQDSGRSWWSFRHMSHRRRHNRH